MPCHAILCSTSSLCTHFLTDLSTLLSSLSPPLLFLMCFSSFLRVSALSRFGVMFIMTHDSIGLGEGASSIQLIFHAAYTTHLSFPLFPILFCLFFTLHLSSSLTFFSILSTFKFLSSLISMLHLFPQGEI